MERKTKKEGKLRSVLSKTPVREGRESTRDRTWDIRSENSDHGGQGQHMRQTENTYRLSPESERRFQPGRAEKAMLAVLKEFLADVKYDTTLGHRMSKLLADTIKAKIKEFKWTRYKLVVHVIIGENKEQDIRAGSRFLWNEETDTYASTTFVNKTLFALAICFGVYTE